MERQRLAELQELYSKMSQKELKEKAKVVNNMILAIEKQPVKDENEYTYLKDLLELIGTYMHPQSKKNEDDTSYVVNDKFKVYMTEQRVEYTTDYELFKFMKGNRDINPKQVEVLVAEYQNNNIKRFIAPVIVNAEYEIVDGQHRYSACRELGVPVRFIVEPDADIDDVQSVNRVSKIWRNKDLMESKLAYNDERYQKIARLQDKYSLHLDIALRIYANSAGVPYKLQAMIGSKSLDRAFKFGKPVMIRDEEEAMRVGKMLYDFVPHLRYYDAKNNPQNAFANKQVQKALITMIERGEDTKIYNHERMLKQLKNYNTKVPYTDYYMTLDWMNKIYNAGKYEHSQVQLLTIKELNHIQERFAGMKVRKESFDVIKKS